MPRTSAPDDAQFRSHRRFAAVWDWATKHESKKELALRREAAGRVEGRVLELGVGVGANWPFLAETLDYVGIEPDAFMLERARKRAAASGRTMTLEQARAEALPFEDESFDSVLVTLTLCTVQDPAVALSEVARVLKPNGVLVFVEHVRPTGRVSRRLADAIQPLWSKVAGGCEPNRETATTIARSGLEIEGMVRQRVNGMPMIRGVARKPAR